MARDCVTHHHACDCREARFREIEAERDALKRECEGHSRARGLLWYAWSAFNAIRARDGAPEGVDHAYWDQLTEHMRTFLGDGAKPWPSVEAKGIEFPALSPAEEPEPTVWTKAHPNDIYCVHCGLTWDMHIAGSNRCPRSPAEPKEKPVDCDWPRCKCDQQQACPPGIRANA